MCPKVRLRKSKSPIEIGLWGIIVPRAGIEPARLAALVFETSASTDSAIWASGIPGRGWEGKGRYFFANPNQIM